MLGSSAVMFIFYNYINQLGYYRQIRVMLCNEGEVYIFEHELYISALENPRLLILLSNYGFLESINIIYNSFLFKGIM